MKSRIRSKIGIHLRRKKEEGNIRKFRFDQQFEGHLGAVYALTQGIDNTFYSAGGDGYIIQWDAATSADGILIAQTKSPVYTLHFIAQFHILVAGCMDGQVVWIDTAKPSLLNIVQLTPYAIYSLIYNGVNVYSGGADGLLTKWDITVKRPEFSIEIGKHALRSIAQYRNALLLGSSDGNIYQYNTDTEKVDVIYSGDHSVFTVLQTHTNEIWAGTKAAKLLKLADKPCTIDAHMYTVNSLIFLPQDDVIVTGSRDRSIKIWNRSSHELNQSIYVHDKGHAMSVNALCYTNQGNILSAGDDRLIKHWRRESKV